MIIVVLAIDYELYFVHRQSVCILKITQPRTCMNRGMCSLQGESFVCSIITGCDLWRCLTEVVTREDYGVDRQHHDRVELHPFSILFHLLMDTTQLQQLRCRVRKVVRLQMSDSSGLYHCSWDGGRLTPTLLSGLSSSLSRIRHPTETDVHSFQTGAINSFQRIIDNMQQWRRVICDRWYIIDAKACLTFVSTS